MGRGIAGFVGGLSETGKAVMGIGFVITATVAVTLSFVGFIGLPDQVSANARLAQENRDSVVVFSRTLRRQTAQVDSVLEVTRRIDRTLCRQVATSERELRECDAR
ncbi:MAG: hypothetical protein AMXMBFR53_36420 [Gemmatimonadota bacterium]